MLTIKQEKDGLSFWVRVTPRASRDQVGPVEGGELKVRLCAPPVEGKANQALTALVAKTLKLAKGKVRVAGGEKSRRKRLLVEGLEPEQLCRLLDL